MEALDVYLNGRKAGRLFDDNGEMSFAYLRDYLDSNSHEPLSYSVYATIVEGVSSRMAQLQDA